MHNMDKFSILKVIWSIDIWDEVHILVRALNWFSVEPPTGRVAVASLLYPPPFPFKVESSSRQCVLLNDKYCVLLSDILGCFHTD